MANNVSLNALRAFEASARHLSLTRAAEELCVTQAAVSHLVKGLEEQLGVALFRRSNRGLKLTDEGIALAPTLFEAFGSIDRMLNQFEAGGVKEVLTVSAVGTFVVGALLERLPEFRAAHPLIDLRILTNNNRVDLVAEGLDCAIRFGDGAWHGSDATRICDAPMTLLCSPAIAAQLSSPADILRFPLLRSYRPLEWPAWLAKAGIEQPHVRGPLFDSSLIMVHAAMLGEGIALAPARLFRREMEAGLIVAPFDTTIDSGSYFLTHLTWKEPTPALAAFKAWLPKTFG